MNDAKGSCMRRSIERGIIGVEVQMIDTVAKALLPSSFS